MKKSILMLGIALICMPFFSILIAGAESYNQILDNISAANEFYKQMSNDNFSDIMESYNAFCDEHYNEFNDNVPDSDELASYFGSYYNASGDNKLDVYLTSFNYLDYYKKYFPSEYANYHIVRYSIFALKEIQEDIESTLTGEFSSEIDILNNTLRFEVESTEDYTRIKNLQSKYDMLEVIQKVTDIELQRDILGGDRLYAGSLTNTYGTVTCNAYKSSTNQHGILTAYHNISDLSSSDDIIIGNYIINKRSKANVNSSIDAAFIPNANSNLTYTWKYSNRDRNQKGYFNGAMSPLSGTTVCVLGQATNERYAKVKSDSTSDLLKYEFSGSSTQKGDSGAPVVVFTKSGTDGRAWLVGIHKGVNASDSKIGQACNIKSACSKLGVVISS